MLDLDLARAVLVDRQRVDHTDGVAEAEPLELRLDLTVEVGVLEAQNQQLHRSDRHRFVSYRSDLTDPLAPAVTPRSQASVSG